MDNSGWKLNEEICSMPAGAADKLLEAADGDCALLYIYFLRRGRAGGAGELCRALGMTAKRFAAAADKLRGLGLLSGSGAPAPDGSLPEYTAEEVAGRSRSDEGFRSVLDECSAVMGRPLSGADMRALHGIYDYLGLPADVIMVLLHHCGEECRRRYGPGRMPTMRQIEKEAYIWVNREIMTLEQAEEYIRSREAVREATEQLRLDFGIHGRQLAPGERRYIEDWLAMGFGVEAIELAYDRTVTNTGALKWNYMDSIMRSWHEKGLHGVEEIEKGDLPRRRQSAPVKRPGRDKPRAEDIERMKRLYDKLKNG